MGMKKGLFTRSLRVPLLVSLYTPSYKAHCTGSQPIILNPKPIPIRVLLQGPVELFNGFSAEGFGVSCLGMCCFLVFCGSAGSQDSMRAPCFAWGRGVATTSFEAYVRYIRGWTDGARVSIADAALLWSIKTRWRRR